MRYLAVSIAAIACVSCQEAGVSATENLITVRAGEPRQKSDGIDWPSDISNDLTVFAIQSPHPIAVVTPKGDSFKVYSKTTFLHMKEGVVCQVDCLPMPEAATRSTAIEAVASIAKELGIHDRESFKHKFASLKASEAALSAPSIWEHLNSDILVIFQVKNLDGASGWFVSMNTYYTPLFPDIGQQMSSPP